MIDVLMILAIIAGAVLVPVVAIVIFETISFVVIMSVYRIQDIIGERKERHKKRFMWYYRTGLVESGCFVELKVAKNSTLWNMR